MHAYLLSGLPICGSYQDPVSYTHLQPDADSELHQQHQRGHGHGQCQLRGRYQSCGEQQLGQLRDQPGAGNGDGWQLQRRCRCFGAFAFGLCRDGCVHGQPELHQQPSLGGTGGGLGNGITSGERRYGELRDHSGQWLLEYFGGAIDDDDGELPGERYL